MNRITLKAIKYNKAMSDETFCYSATVYFDGKRVGLTMNRGHGSDDEIEVTNANGWTKMDNYVSTLPRIDTEYPSLDKDTPAEKFSYTQTAESIFHGLVSNWLLERDIKNQLRGKICYYRGAWNNEFSHLSTKRNPERKIREWLERNRPGAIILNDLPMEKLVALWERDQEAA
jgi:hypothetical protein